MGTADLDFDSEINLVSVSPEGSKAGTLPLPRERGWALSHPPFRVLGKVSGIIITVKSMTRT